MQNNESHEVLAAVDLGSNSFHMIIARKRDGHFQVIDRLREMVQLRAGLDENFYLSEEAQARAIACLERFGERVRNLPYGSVRVVGTNTLRVAHNSRRFLKKARQALGHPIEIITGEEEARLIYLGVSHALAFDEARRLVMDIGGGSTEFIIGEAKKGLMRESLEMGCVSFTEKYFPNGKISDNQIRMAVLHAAQNIRAIKRPYRKLGWEEAVGASGTIRCVANICREEGWSPDGVITVEALDNILERLHEAEDFESIQLAGLSEERRTVIVGGVCILASAFERLGIKRMTVSDGALREGLLRDLIGRIEHDDERHRTVQRFVRRYRIDEVHADRVTKLAVQFYEQVAKKWQIQHEEFRQLLMWACMLHEVGLSISHSSFHKHSAYLIKHSDMSGFSREEQLVLSVMLRGQRKSFPKKDLKELPDDFYTAAKCLTILLRLSMVFNRGRSERTDTFFKLAVTENKITLRLPAGWLAEHPLTEADLEQEAAYLKKVDYKLVVETE